MKKLMIWVIIAVLCLPAAVTFAEKNIEIGYMSWNGGAQQVSEEAYFEQYEQEHPGVKINSEFIPWANYYNKLNTLIAANASPDIFFTSEDTLINYAEKGMALDLRPYYEAKGIDMLEVFHPGTMYVDGDKVYSIANGLSCLVMYYNKDLFKEKNVETPSLDAENPWTWDQYLNAARALTQDSNGKTPNDEGFDANSIVTFGTLAPTWNRNWITLLYSAGGSLATEDGMALNLDNDAARKVLQSIADLMLVHKVAPTAAISASLPGQPQMFKDKQLGMAIGGAWSYINFRNEGIDVGVAPLPMFDKPMSTAWGSAYMLSSQSKNPQEAFDFLSDFIDPNVNPSQLTFMQPNMLDLYTEEKLAQWMMNDDFYNEDFRTTIPKLITKVAIAGENVKLKDFGPIVDQTISPILDNFWLGTMTLDEAIAECYTKTEGMFRGF